MKINPIKTFFKQYFWFWKESFSFMHGHNKLRIAWGCLKQAHKFASDMVKWEKLTSEQKEHWYLTSDRTIEF